MGAEPRVGLGRGQGLCVELLEGAGLEGRSSGLGLKPTKWASGQETGIQVKSSEK